MKKILNSTILQCLIIFIVIFIYNTYLDSTFDHIIDFTHCYSLAKGLKIYTDYNIVIGPIYPLFISIFLILFGNNLLVFNIINSLFVAVTYYLIKKENKKTISFFLFILLQGILIAKYNTFTLLLFYIIYFLEKKEFKYQDYIIGLLISLAIFTKINIGIFLVLPTFILYWKNHKKIIKRLITILISSSIIILVMYISKVLPGFINYTILGLIDFKNSTSSVHGTHSIGIWIILLFLTTIYIFKNIKKDKLLLYMFFYLSMSYPSLDFHHVLLAIFPTVTYFLDKQEINKKTCLIFSIITITFYSSFLIINSNKIFQSKMDCKNKYCSQSITFNDIFNEIHKINKLLSEDKYKDYEIYYLNYYAYFYKLDSKQNINKYDFIWEGNMGYNGEEKYINEIKNTCKKQKCLFLIDEDIINSKNINEKLSKKIIKFIIKEYDKSDEQLIYNNIDIYTNKKVNE